MKRTIMGLTGTTHIHEPGSVYSLTANDYIFGTHVIGAVGTTTMPRAPRLGVVLSRSPGGRTLTTLKVGKAKTHADTVANAREVGKRAISVGRRLKAALAKTTSRGVILGVGGVRRKSALRISPAKARKLADKVIAAGKSLLSRAKKHAAMVQAHAAKTQAASLASAARLRAGETATVKRKIPGTTTMRTTRVPGALKAEILTRASQSADRLAKKAEHAVLGSVLGDRVAALVGAQQSDYPGWLVNDAGQYYPDPLWTDAERASEPTPPGPFGSAPAGTSTTSTTSEPSGDADYAPDYSDVGPKPTFETLPPREDFTPDPFPNQAVDDPTMYDSLFSKLPEGIVFNPEQPRHRDIGSVTRFVGGAGGVNESNNERRMYAESVGNAGAGGVGYALERNGGWGNSGYQWGGGDASIMDGWYLWWNGNTSGYQFKKDEPGGGLGDKFSKDLRARSERSIGFNWGPITGNPAKEETKHLRVDVATGKTFWFWDTAPEKFKRPYELDRLNKEILDWATRKAAAETLAAAKALQDALDAEEDRKRAKEQARVDADDQRRRDKEAQEAAHQWEVSASRQEAEERQMAIEAQKVELEERRAMAEAVARGEYYPPYGEEGYYGDGEEGVDWGDGEEGLAAGLDAWQQSDAAQAELNAQFDEG